MKKKFVFLGDTNSINIELICKSHKFLKNKIKYVIIGNINELIKYLLKIRSNLLINEINNPYKFENYNKNCLNIFNIENISKLKHLNLLNQINIANHLANSSKLDLITMPIDKSIFKKNMNFNGMTEYLSEINKKDTKMLMHGEKFSIIPLTTHINIKSVNKFINEKNLKKSINIIRKNINKKIYNFNFKEIRFLCYNPHCSENETLGIEDKIIKKSISKINKISGPYSADSAFNNINYKILFISMYHDQALIPFKILNKKGINITIGLNYKRLSPAHGTAKDIKFKNISDNRSFLACMEN